MGMGPPSDLAVLQAYSVLAAITTAGSVIEANVNNKFISTISKIAQSIPHVFATAITFMCIYEGLSFKHSTLITTAIPISMMGLEYIAEKTNQKEIHTVLKGINEIMMIIIKITNIALIAWSLLVAFIVAFGLSSCVIPHPLWLPIYGSMLLLNLYPSLPSKVVSLVHKRAV